MWFDDASYKDVSGNSLMTIGESQQLQKLLNMAQGGFSKELLNKIKVEKNPLSIGVQLKAYLNNDYYVPQLIYHLQKKQQLISNHSMVREHRKK